MRIVCRRTMWLAVAALGISSIAGTAYAQGTPGSGGAVSAPAGTVTPSMITGQVVSCVGGKAGPFPCRQVDLLAYLPVAVVGGTGGGATATSLTDVWGWRDSVTRREFLLVGRIDGTAFLDVTNPVQPRYLGELPLPKGAKPSLRHIKVYQQYAYIVADSVPMQVVDLSQLRAASGAPVTFQEMAHFDSLVAQVGTFALDPVSGFAYAGMQSGPGCRGTLKGIDIRLPTAPRFLDCAGSYNNYSYRVVGHRLTDVAGARCIRYRGPDPLYRGRQICFIVGMMDTKYPGLAIVDVTGANMSYGHWVLSLTGYPNASQAQHGSLSADEHYFFLADGPQGAAGDTTRLRTIVFDVSRLGEPSVVAELAGAPAMLAHDLQVRGLYLYQANDQAGVRVIDVHDPTKPREVGFFDTTPTASETARDEGAWRVYPFVGPEKDGVVAIASVTEGVFLVRFRP